MDIACMRVNFDSLYAVRDWIDRPRAETQVALDLEGRALEAGFRGEICQRSAAAGVVGGHLTQDLT
jgi:hypothetical protein